jgi:hypothetical protein
LPASWTSEYGLRSRFGRSLIWFCVMTVATSAFAGGSSRDRGDRDGLRHAADLELRVSVHRLTTATMNASWWPKPLSENLTS